MSKAKFSTKTKREIVERDVVCIICSKQGTDVHHARFGPIETNYGPDRNEAKEGCLLCRDCHNLAHSCSVGEGVRQQCIEYINNLK